MSKMNTDYLILVDKDDNPIGTEEKIKCHLPNGKLHRAFTILLFNKDGKLLLTRRSQNKMLWPGDWDGTVASHPRQSETYVSSAERRLPEEIGISCKLDYLFKFEYHVPYKNIGSENEICGTLIGIIEDDAEIKLVKKEIDATKWVSVDELLDDLKKVPEIYCPWMILALYFLPNSKTDISSEHKSILNVWNRKDINQILEKPVQYHFPDKKWELK
jgi:isopentenyl-diphosphate delta-isomerase